MSDQIKQGVLNILDKIDYDKIDSKNFEKKAKWKKGDDDAPWEIRDDD